MIARMSKTSATASSETAPKKRSKLKLAIFAAVPLVLAGAGYAGWAMFLAAPAAEAYAGDGHGPDPVKVAAVPPEIAAEGSFTHSYALSVVIEDKCGTVDTTALRAASDEEAHADGMLVNLSWVAATRRAAKLVDSNCGRLLGEVENANDKALRIAEARAGKDGKGEKGGH